LSSGAKIILYRDSAAEYCENTVKVAGGGGMTFWRRTAGWGAAIAGVAFILFGAFMRFRSLQRYYYAYGPATDDLNMRILRPTWEIEAWAATVDFIVSGFILLRLAKTLRRSN
jgi:hypothetical protein